MPAGRQRNKMRTAGRPDRPGSYSLRWPALAALSADGIFESQPLSEIAVRVTRRTAARSSARARRWRSVRSWSCSTCSDSRIAGCNRRRRRRIPAAELAQVGRVTEIWKRLCDQARYYLEVCALRCMRCRSARGTVRRCTSLFLEHCIPSNLTSASRTLQLEVGASLVFFRVQHANLSAYFVACAGLSPDCGSYWTDSSPAA